MGFLQATTLPHSASTSASSRSGSGPSLDTCNVISSCCCRCSYIMSIHSSDDDESAINVICKQCLDSQQWGWRVQHCKTW
jgi:hypothetical protein